MSPYYSIPIELKTCEPIFDPLLDSSQCPVYDGMNYVPNVAMQKMQNGRQKKKHFHNEMDDMKKGYDNDMYDLGDFDQKNKVHYFGYHGEGNNMNRHKEGPKRNPRACGTTGRNRRSGATDIIEVTHMSIMKKYFICWYVVI
jgi:hypothetical protein